jgi:hypothetical protein
MPKPVLPRLCVLALASFAVFVAHGMRFTVERSGVAEEWRGTDDFARHIAPLLTRRCLACHSDHGNGTGASGGYRVDTRAGLIAGGESGPAIVVGAADRSPLLSRVAPDADVSTRMPPEGPRLAANEVAILRQWIERGAPWPTGLTLKSPRATAASHWAFLPIRRPVPPTVRSSERAWNAIDHFVLARLESLNVSPAPPADPATLFRRVMLDLTGLPPSHEDATTLAEERSREAAPDAYDREVDRLLASPAYGERWARPWLDASHFADTDGYLTDQERPVAWRYRQSLIDSLNADQPFDQFTVEQLAGDLLPNAAPSQRIASGFLRNTLSNREGGADLEEYRVEQVVDRVAMVGAGWLGMTVGCARCHDHKYDPLTQREFFELYAIFDAADEVNLAVPLPGEAEPFAAAYADYRRQRDALIAPLKTELEALQLRWEQRLLEAAAAPSQDPQWDRQWEVLGLIWGGRQGEGQLEGCEIVRTPWRDRSDDERDRIQDYFLAHGSLIDPEKFRDLKLETLRKEVTSLRGKVPWPTRAPTMRAARHPRSVHIHQRGDFRVPGGLVGAAVPEWLAPRPMPNDSSARLALAKWLVAPKHPLTARVVANRAWQEFFGRGLVDPPEDFGLRGRHPSHPELLDWLAAEWPRHGWSVKWLHRAIVSSATYRQSSRARDSSIATRDPRNEWLARQTPLRLSSDQVRDAALAASGLLVRRVGGPSVFPPQPASVAKEGFSNDWKPSEGAGRYRRGLYTWIQRLSPYAHNVTFDAPPTNAVCVRRERTNSPLQALALLNDPVFDEAARALAERMLANVPANMPADVTADGALSESGILAARIASLMRIAVARAPTDAEVRILADYWRSAYERASADFKGVNEGEAAAKQSADSAAWVSVCSVILNLHEFVTRE